MEFPWGRFGVVDCFSFKPKKGKSCNPTLEYLQKNAIKELSFLCWTHPHRDHSSGMAELMREFKGKINSFWRFDGLSLTYLFANYRKYLERNKNNVESIKKEKHRSKYLKEAYSEYLDYLNECKSNKEKIKKVSFGKESLFIDKENDIKIIGVSPVDWFVENYEKDLLRDAQERKCGNILQLQSHNRVSAALMVHYGKARILLGADTENETWKVIDDDDTTGICKHPVHFVKVPHHGSENAIYAPLWQKWSLNNEPYTVITSHKNSRKILPQESAIKKFLTYTSKIWIVGAIQGRGGQAVRGSSINLIYPMKKITSRLESVQFEIHQNGTIKEINPIPTTE